MAENIGTAYVQIVPTAKGISGKIEQELGGVGKSAGQSFSSGFGSVLGGISKAAIGAVSVAATAVGGLVKSATDAYANFEQLEGGAKLLFGDAFDTVIDNADSAFARVQMSASDYLQQANGYAVGLKEALGNDSQAAADLADKIMVAQADIVAATGNSQEAVQNAFNGIMKNNFSMLDNLQLGIKPTKEGMQEVIDLMNKWNAEQGKTTKYQMGNLADMQSAIVDYVSYVGMTGYAHDEASKTITGSLAAMKAQWENTLVAMSQGDGWDMGIYIENLTETVKTFANNVMPIIEQSLVGVSSLIESLAPEIAAAIPSLITQVLPGLLSAGVSVIDALAQGILGALPGLMPCVMEVINSLLNLILQLAPQLLSAGLDIILQLANGITSALPTLIPTLTSVLLEIVTMLTDPGTLTSLIQAGIDMLLALVDGFNQALPEIISQLPTIIENLCSAFSTALPLLIDAGIQLANMMVANLPVIIQALIDAAPSIIESLCTALISNAPLIVAAGPMIMLQFANGLMQQAPQLWELGKQLIDAIVQGLASAYANLTAEGPKMLSQLYQRMLASLKQFLEVGRSLVKQIIEGLKQFGENLYKQGTELMNKLKEKIVNAIKGFGEVGKNIVNGIKEGLASAWGELEKWFTEKINALKNKVKDVLKIESPSKVFADEIGRMIPLGIAQGIEDGMNALDTSVLDMTAGIVGSADQAMSAATYQSVPSASGDVYGLLANYLPLIANKEVNIKLEGGMDRFFRAMQTEARRNYQLTGAAL